MEVNPADRLKALISDLDTKPARLPIEEKDRLFVRALGLVDRVVGPGSHHRKEIESFRHLGIAAGQTDFEADAGARVKQLAAYLPLVIEDAEMGPPPAPPSKGAAEVPDAPNVFQNYGNVGAIQQGGQGNKQDVTVNIDGGKKYAIAKEDVGTVEWWSRLVLGLLGEKRTKISSAISAALAVLTFLSGTYQVGSLPKPSPITAGMVAAVFLVLTLGLAAALQHQKARKCPECGVDYALKEIGKPYRVDVDLKKGTNRTTTRFYRCSSCNREFPVETTRFISDDTEE